MSYSQFTIDQVKEKLGVTLAKKTGIFANCQDLEYSNLLQETLKFNIPLALEINSEKAKSELIISPILVELKRQLITKISLFSGRDFNVAPELGLTGFCDFIISRSPEQLIIEAPVIFLVEAKNDNIQANWAQCIAEMVAAQIFNERQGQKIKTIYGVVTTGSIWSFLKLEGKAIEIDLQEYFLNNVGKILGIFTEAIESS